MTPFDESTDSGRFIPVDELADKLDALRESLIASGAPQNRRNLRANDQRPAREAWHAMLFACAYECYFRISGMRVRIEPRQYSAHDATLQWLEDNFARELKVQLKELPPERLNAEISLSELLAKSVAKYPPSPDLTMAVFISRTHPGYSIEIPRNEFAGLWAFGFTGIGEPEFIFLVGKDAKGEHSNCKKFV